MSAVITAAMDPQAAPAAGASPAAADAVGYRVRPIMKQGTPSIIPATWRAFATLDEARQAVKAMYHDDRVMRVYIVRDEVPPQFVEWVER